MATAKAKAEPKPIYDPAKGFTGKELRDFLRCYQSGSFPTDAVKSAIAKGENHIVATKAAPGNQVWSFIGEGKQRRFFKG